MRIEPLGLWLSAGFEIDIPLIPQHNCGEDWQTCCWGLNLQPKPTDPFLVMNEGEAELLSALHWVVTVFEALNVEYLVGGSVASSVFGEPRQTMDADVVARLLIFHTEPFVERVKETFYVDASTMRTAIQTQGCFNLIHLESMTKIDVFVRWRGPFAESQLARRQKKQVGELDLYLATAEDTVLAKLEWYRKGGEISDRQWRDILGVIKVQGHRLDQTYLTHWASEIGVKDLLDRALSDAGTV